MLHAMPDEQNTATTPVPVAPSVDTAAVRELLGMMKATLLEWDIMQKWHDGLWGDVYKALEKYAQIQ